jgi:hypothetical protein
MFFTSFVCADDYTVSDLKIDDVVIYGQDFNVTVYASNNTNSPKTINIDINIFSPKGVVVYSNTIPIVVDEHSTKNHTEPVRWISGQMDSNLAKPSNNSYLVQAVVVDGGSIVGNTKRNYFIVSGGQRKIPVPDMPIILSFAFLALVVVIFTKKNKK